MKKFFLTLLATLAFLGMAAQKPAATTVPGDPMATQCYTLSNGLKVFLSVNHQSPRISAHIAVRTGSRNDPAETTGLAHYLEHLMFKGTQQYGTSNYAAEKAVLDTIEARYEQYRLVKDPERRRVLYHEIDSISQLAAQYNIPVLAKLPVCTDLAKHCDQGTIELYEGEWLNEAAEKIADLDK